MAERLGEIQKRVITVCDREADIWHYLHYNVSRGKPHAECDAKRRAAARQARMLISYSEVSIKNPDNSDQALSLTYVCCREQERTEPAGIR
ncbi:putative transposase [Escherichia coli DEC2A]|nr:putative transposase [Escherichia coli DEC2A]